MTKMNYAEEIVKELVNKGYEAETQEYVKNNDTKLVGVTLGPKVDITPVIYIDKFFDAGKSVGSAVDIIIAQYEQLQGEERPDVDLTDSSKIVFRLVNAEANASVLADRPHRMVEDLAVQYYLVVVLDKDGLQSVPVTNDVAESNGWSEEDLYNFAKENTPRIFDTKISTLAEMLGLPEEFDPGLYLLSNEQCIFGANAILNDEILDKCLEKIGADEIVILPSSVHEVLFLDINGAENAAGLIEVVTSINGSELLPQDILSNSVYSYSKENGFKMLGSGDAIASLTA
jgi:hypothetical protein